MAGPTATGFEAKTTREIIDDIAARQRATIDPALDLGSETPDGQNNGIFADQLAQAWEALEILYHGFDPDGAGGDLLLNLAKLTGTPRRAAAPSTVTLACDLNSGTQLLADEHFAAIDGNEDVLWTPVEDFTAPSTGSHDVEFESVDLGEVAGPSGTITVIKTPVTGWNSVTNASDATLGRPVDTDATLRTRREQSLTASGSGTPGAVAADVLAVDNVETAQGYENDANTTDSEGRPPGSIEILLWDNGLADDDDIAQAIWDSKSGGIKSFSASGDSGTAIDQTGTARTVEFTRVAQKEIHLEIDVETGAGFPGESAMEAAVATAADDAHDQGDDVAQSKIIALSHDVEGVASVSAVRLGFSPSPTGTDDLTIALREIARFDSSRITVTVV